MRALRPLLAALALLAAAAVHADQRLVALGGDGELYRVLAGRYGELFTDGGTPADNPVLAVEVVRPGQPPTRLLVPGTEGTDVEGTPAIVYEQAVDSLFLVWESRINNIHSQIKLARLGADGWAESVHLPGEYFSLKTAPSLAFTRDSFVGFDDAGNPVVHSRTIYHVVWWEEAGAGNRVVYCPYVLVDGAYIGWSPIFDLNDLDFGPPAAGALPTEELTRTPAIRAGKDGKSVVVGLVDPASGQLVELEIEVVPGELGGLAEAIRGDLEGFLAASPEATLGNLADRARVQIIEIGHRLGMHPGVVSYVADATAGAIAAAGDQPRNELADRARVQIIEIGFRMAGQGLAPAPDDLPGWLMEFPNEENPGGPAGELPLHSLHGQLTAARPIPEIGAGPTALYLSRDGKQALVSWSAGNQVLYRESTGGGWSEVHRLDLNAELTLAQAQAILSQRTRDR
jgi:hypothetical protein